MGLGRPSKNEPNPPQEQKRSGDRRLLDLVWARAIDLGEGTGLVSAQNEPGPIRDAQLHLTPLTPLPFPLSL